MSLSLFVLITIDDLATEYCDSPPNFVSLNTVPLQNFFTSESHSSSFFSCCVEHLGVAVSGRLNLCSFNMKNPFPDHVIGIPVSSVSYTVEKSAGETTSVSETDTPYFLSIPSKESAASKQNRVDTLLKWIHKLGMKAEDFTHGIRDHVMLGPKVSATVKGKLRLGARILQEGGVEKLFKKIFRVAAGEKLVNASHCYLSTTSGPIAGLLFISTERVAFCSERSVTFSLPTGELIRAPYKVMIPLKKIKGANQSENVKNTTQKYMQVVTVDKFEFWFMGFLNYQKAFKYIQQSISQY